jgi:hypothetical protein
MAEWERAGRDLAAVEDTPEQKRIFRGDPRERGPLGVIGLGMVTHKERE